MTEWGPKVQHVDLHDIFYDIFMIWWSFFIIWWCVLWCVYDFMIFLWYVLWYFMMFMMCLYLKIELHRRVSRYQLHHFACRRNSHPTIYKSQIRPKSVIKLRGRMDPLHITIINHINVDDINNDVNILNT